jgi:putative ABC transport system substrate-binding protein
VRLKLALRRRRLRKPTLDRIVRHDCEHQQHSERNHWNAADIERAIDSFARVANGGLVVPPGSTTILHRNLIIALAARHRLPAVYAFRFFVAAGGLMSYATDLAEQYRQAATYVDRILRGEKPADLPVQAPTKFETVVNLKTAAALGLTVPPGILVGADEAID